VNAAPKAEIATVIQNFLPELHRQKPLPNHHLRTLHALQRCRTEAMGGRVEHCDQCGHEQILSTVAVIGTAQNVAVLTAKNG